jgi:hypothetical protein
MARIKTSIERALRIFCLRALDLTLMLQTYTGKNRCARVIARHLRPCSEQDITYGQVRFILS